jgi:hypothetical protein
VIGERPCMAALLFRWGTARQSPGPLDGPVRVEPVAQLVEQLTFNQ